MNEHWSDRFVGLPYLDLGRERDGCDCWGLACIIYREELSISLPDYLGYANTDERAEIAALVSGATTSPLWVPVNGQAMAFDVALFRRGRLTSHVGIVVSHGLMIHMAEAEMARIEHYNTGHWAPRLVGHYRHVEMVSKVVR